jgi:hypothetical protein
MNKDRQANVAVPGPEGWDRSTKEMAMKTRTLSTGFAGLAFLGLSVALLLPAVSLAGAAPDAQGCVVVLAFPGGQKLTAVPDAAGKFVFQNLPAGTGTLSVVVAAPKDPAADDAGTPPAVGKGRGTPAPGDGAGAAKVRESPTRASTGKRQHNPPPVIRVVLDDAPDAAKTQALDDWQASPVTVVLTAESRRKELTGHVTLIK